MWTILFIIAVILADQVSVIPLIVYVIALLYNTNRKTRKNDYGDWS